LSPYTLIKFYCVLTYPPYIIMILWLHTTGMNHLKIDYPPKENENQNSLSMLMIHQCNEIFISSLFTSISVRHRV